MSAYQFQKPYNHFVSLGRGWDRQSNVKFRTVFSSLILAVCLLITTGYASLSTVKVMTSEGLVSYPSVFVGKVVFTYTAPAGWDSVTVGISGCKADGTPVAFTESHSTQVKTCVFTLNSNFQSLYASMRDLDNGEAQLLVDETLVHTFTPAKEITKFAMVTPTPPEKRFIAVVLLTWNEWYFNGSSNWGDLALFKPELGSYINSDPAVIEQQIRWMDQVGVDICFITVNHNDSVDWMRRFLNKGDEISSKVKFAAYFNGYGIFTAETNLPLEGVDSLAAAHIFDHPRYFRWDERPVVSGYLDDVEGDEIWHLEYWIEVKEKYPDLSIWAQGWHCSLWAPLDGYVDTMIVTVPNKNATVQAECYNLCDYHPLLIHSVAVASGFDSSAIPRNMPSLDRRNGNTFIDYWQMIPNLIPSPEVVLIFTWNDYGECSGIEPILESRSPTTDAFGHLYLDLTDQYGNLFKSGEL